MKQYKTDQESFWAGEFGTEYIKRNQGGALLASNLNFFTKSLQSAYEINSAIEFGANIGMNLKALKLLRPLIDISAIEINDEAVNLLSEVVLRKNIFQESILDFKSNQFWDLVLIKGVLIHINPEFLPQAYKALYDSSNRYILVCEYYNPSPVEINYRGHKDRLFKRDFAGEMLKKYIDLKLIDYGFIYKNDPNFPQDDISWFLMEKSD